MEEEEKAIEEINNSLVNDFDDVVMKKTRSNSLDGVFDLEDVDIKNIIDQTEERGTMYPFEGIVPSVEQSPEVSMSEEECFDRYMETIFLDIIDQLKMIIDAKSDVKEQKRLIQIMTSTLTTEVDDNTKSFLSKFVDLPDHCYYYNLLSDYISELSTKNDSLVEFIQLLKNVMSNEMIDPFIVLCLYKYIYINFKNINISKQERFFIINSIYSTLSGLSRVFWYDIHCNTEIFKSLYNYYKMILSDIVEKKEVENIDKELFVIYIQNIVLCLTRYCLYYDSVEEIRDYLEMIQDLLQFLNVEKDASSVFYSCINIQLEHIHSEETLILYLEKLGELKISLPEKFRYRIQVTLNRLSTPGGPFFPPSSVRQVARKTNDQLYPDNLWIHKYIHYLFRFFHPYYTTESIARYWWQFSSSVASLWYNANKSVLQYIQQFWKAIYMYYISFICLLLNVLTNWSIHIPIVDRLKNYLEGILEKNKKEHEKEEEDEKKKKET